MATVRNASPVAQTIPSLGLTVAAGATFEAPDEVAAELVARPDFDTPTSSGATFEAPDEVAAELVARPDFDTPTPTRKPAPGKSKES